MKQRANGIYVTAAIVFALCLSVTANPVSAQQPTNADDQVPAETALPESSSRPAPQDTAPPQPEAEPALAAEPVPAHPPVQAEPASTEPPPAEPGPGKKEESWADRISVKGDLRYRFETIKQGDGDLRYRHRIRARPAMQGKVFNDLDVIIGLGTGAAEGSDDSGDPKSNNQSLDSGFSSKWIWLDLAYFDYHPGFVDGLSIWGGKMKNPLYKVGNSELLWDPDLNPEGLALNFQREFGMFEPFLHGVSFFVEERKADDDTWQLGAQAGARLSFADGKLYVLAGGRYMNHIHLKGQPLIWDEGDAFGNATETVDVTDVTGTVIDSYLVYANDCDVVGAFGEVGGEIFGLPWAVFGDFAINTAVDDENLGWLAGALLGKAKKQWSFHLRYIYRRVEADAVFGLFTDSDFNNGDTDGKGHEWNFVLALHERVQLAFTYFYNKTPIEPHNETAADGTVTEVEPADYHRTQTDIKIKF